MSKRLKSINVAFTLSEMVPSQLPLWESYWRRWRSEFSMPLVDRTEDDGLQDCVENNYSVRIPEEQWDAHLEAADALEMPPEQLFSQVTHLALVGLRLALEGAGILKAKTSLQRAYDDQFVCAQLVSGTAVQAQPDKPSTNKAAAKRVAKSKAKKAKRQPRLAG